MRSELLRSMTKDDWLKLAMPASITLLAMAVFTTPMLVKAQFTDSIRILQGGEWQMKVVNVEKKPF